MIKIDYEGAWKEFKRKYGVELYLRKKHYNIFLYSFMNDMEQKHTHDYIDIRKRSDKEIADYCLKKYGEMYLENINLKKKLEDKNEGGYLFRDDGGYGTEMIKKYKDYINKNRKGGEK